jgi:heavy metal sensor kinase
MKRLSIGLRLTLWYLAIFALGVGMWFILRENLYDMVDDDAENQVEDLKDFLQTQSATTPLPKVQEEVNETYAKSHWGDYLAIYTEQGGVIYSSKFLQAHSSSIFRPSQLSQPVSISRTIEGRIFRFLFEKLEVNGKTYIVAMGLPADDAVDTLRQFRSYLLMFAPLLLLVAAAVGYWMSRRALSPVDAIVQTARSVGAGSLNSRLQKLDTGDELQRLSDTLNEMLDRIEAAFLRITQFTADASHELRTPVSLIRTEAELALRRSRSEREYQESLRHILLEAERTTGLIEQLLTLARADSGRETLHLESVDLVEMLRNVADGWKQVAAIRDVQFSTHIHDPHAFVNGDQGLLRRLIDVLLDNAFKYTSSPDCVSLRLEVKDDQALISVEDSGVGIPPEEQSKIFERFYRVDKARSRAQGGIGLGLSIAQWIVTQHNGSISVESDAGKGSVFRVALPVTAPPVRNPLPA